jgi:hypothetical protein
VNSLNASLKLLNKTVNEETPRAQQVSLYQVKTNQNVVTQKYLLSNEFFRVAKTAIGRKHRFTQDGMVNAQLVMAEPIGQCQILYGLTIALKILLIPACNTMTK